MVLIVSDICDPLVAFFMRSRFLIAAAITVQLQWAAGLVDQYPLVVPDRISKLDLNPLPITNRKGSDVVMPGTELRVLFAGDSITLGTLSDSDGGDGNGFRLRFRDGLRSKYLPPLIMAPNRQVTVMKRTRLSSQEQRLLRTGT